MMKLEIINNIVTQTVFIEPYHGTIYFTKLDTYMNICKNVCKNAYVIRNIFILGDTWLWS